MKRLSLTILTAGLVSWTTAVGLFAGTAESPNSGTATMTAKLNGPEAQFLYELAEDIYTTDDPRPGPGMVDFQGGCIYESNPGKNAPKLLFCESYNGRILPPFNRKLSTILLAHFTLQDHDLGKVLPANYICKKDGGNYLCAFFDGQLPSQGAEYLKPD